MTITEPTAVYRGLDFQAVDRLTQYLRSAGVEARVSVLDPHARGRFRCCQCRTRQTCFATTVANRLHPNFPLARHAREPWTKLLAVGSAITD